MHPTTQALLDHLSGLPGNAMPASPLAAWLEAGAPDRSISRIEQIRQWVMLQRNPAAAHEMLTAAMLQRLVLKPVPGYNEATRLLAEYRAAYAVPT